MSDQWFILSYGEQSGPYTGEQLVQYAQQGGINAETLVWTEGMPEWLPATQIEGLLPKPAPTPAPAPAWAPPGTRRPGTAGAAPGKSPSKELASSSVLQAINGGDYPYFPVKQASFGLWISTLLGGFVFMIVGTFVTISSAASQTHAYSNGAEEMPAPQIDGLGIIIALLGSIALMVSMIYFYIILYRVWKCLQAGSPRTTPGKAVGLLFIPLFNLYWMFVAIAGVPKDWNRIIASHPNLHPAPKLNETTFLMFCIGTLVFPPLAIIVMFSVVSQMCKGLNFFEARRNPNAAGAYHALGGR